MATRKLRGARVLVTGASSGIGRALAVQLVAAGARVIVTARREAELQQLAADLEAGTDCLAIAGDITSPEHRLQLLRGCESWGGLDLLINNAGIGAIGPFRESDAERLRQVMEVNFFAPIELTRLLLPILQRGDRPTVVLIGSVLALAAVPLKSEYCASKHALHGWAESVGPELRQAGIELLEVHPSTTASEFFTKVLGDPSQQRSLGAMTPEVAATHILRAIRRGRRQAVFPLAGQALVALRRWCPPLFRWVTRPQ
ncbi:MAG: SDR family NAD(P)-dependent oxidoreductase [Planctomycetales bacterium]|nr:SDR family NAD(P)-dependent oxidoreductase [Planctomycetales bacterium]